MAFQTNVLQNGTWVSKTVDIQSFLAVDKSSAGNATESRKPPACGLLTRTVVESPAVHFILPVRLRSSSHNDVAFISDHYVEVKEYRNGQLHNVAKKSDFRGRIQDAGVLGSFFEDWATKDSPLTGIGTGTGTGPVPFSPGEGIDDTSLRGFEESPSMPPQDRILPPQVLVVTLGLGRFVFMFLKQDAQGHVEFVCSYTDNTVKSEGESRSLVQLAIDPSSRYMAASCPGEPFVVYQLRPPESLREQYRKTGSIQPIVSSRFRPVAGKIHKMEFLFPRPEDDESVILSFVMVLGEGKSSRLLTYDWEFDDDLNTVFYPEKEGFPLPSDHELPLLLIPLTVNSSLLSVSEHSIAVIPNILQGPSMPELVATATRPASGHHIGRKDPMWTAWARPLRRQDFYDNNDHVYLAREDGSITFLEMNSTEILESSLELAETRTSIFTAFAALGAPSGADVLVIGGNCGSGTIWEFQARQSPKAPASVIPNWSPAVDFATTDEFLAWDQQVGLGDKNPMIPWRKQAQNDLNKVKYDRLFSTAGRGVDGSVMEYRQGVPSDIALDVECHSPLRKIWAFPASRGFNVLLNYHLLSKDRVHEVLHIPYNDVYDSTGSADEIGGIWSLDDAECGFDKTVRTLAAVSLSDEDACQVTERSIVTIGPSQSSRHPIDRILDVPDIRAENACIRGELIALSTMSTQSSFGFQIHLLTNINTVLRSLNIDRESTCIEFCSVGDQRYILAALWQVNHTSLCLYPVDSSASDGPTLEVTLEIDTSQPESVIDAITSLVIVHESAGKTVVAGGTRGGFFIAMELTSQEGSIRAAHRVERYADSPIEVVTTPATPKTIFAYWETGLVRLSDYDLATDRGFRERQRIVPVHSNAANIELPNIDSVAQLQSLLLVASGSRLLVTTPKRHSELVPRQIRLNCTPMRIIYSHALRCLVVAVTDNNKPALMFVDPDTGLIPSQPTNSNRQARQFVPGLGQEGDNVLALREWIYEKGGSTFSWLLVGTRQGFMIVISAVRPALQKPDEDENKKPVADEIEYWTRIKKGPFEEPVSSIYADGDDIFYCSGTTIHWDYLDLTNKRIQNKAHIEAPSPVLSINIRDEKLFALTDNDSMQVIDLRLTREEPHVSLSDYGYLEPAKRPTMHMMDVGDSGGSDVSWPITLVSDKCRQVAGVWLPDGPSGTQLAVLFEATVPAMIRRFGRARTRPSWWRADSRPRYGRIPSTVDDAEIFGLGLDGSMQHFTLLDPRAWRFLRLLYNLGNYDPGSFIKGYPRLAKRSDPEPDRHKQLHVDADTLQLIAERRAIGALLAAPQDAAYFRSCLDELDEGRWTAGFRDDPSTMDEKYVRLAYDVLDYFLTPVF